ncbi:MAG: hypothetical protein CL681_14340 [Blastopirellula sp.]|nr:hypothetical protein [Blastopirellula sp.]
MKFNCFHCRKEIEISDDLLSESIVCPHCQSNVSVPKTHVGDEELSSPKAFFLQSWFSNSFSGLVSLIVHMCLMLMLAFVTCDLRGGRGEGDEVLIGELPDVNLSDDANEELDSADEQAAPAEEEVLEEALDIVTPPSQDTSSDVVEVNLSQLVPSGAIGGEGMEIGSLGGGGGGGGGSGASFMGLSATGSRFCIIADRSGSMAGPKLDYVKTEILETLTTMGRRGRFQLIFFNDRALPYPEEGWRNPTKDRTAVEDWLKTVSSGGGTSPVPAFRQAFLLSPRPDAIFFMTDGLFPAQAVGQIANLNQSGTRVTIHTISFMDRSSEQLMKQIATDSGGKYRHVSGF